MSNVNIGFVDGRMGSRILKPPGGGYSEIFFTAEDSVPKKAPQTRTETVLESILRSEEVVTKAAAQKTHTQTKTETIEKKVEELSIQEKNEVKETTNGEKAATEEVDAAKGDKVEAVPPEPQTPEPKVIQPKSPEPKTPESEGTPRRARVPPGGFSSGLW